MHSVTDMQSYTKVYSKTYPSTVKVIRSSSKPVLKTIDIYKSDLKAKSRFEL